MDFNDINNLNAEGFVGYESIKNLWLDKSIIPRKRGVYLVLNPAHYKTEYLKTGVGGFFKEKNPNVSNEDLKRNYVPDSLVVYIGKAGSISGNATLYSRLGQYLSFGQTKNVGHWGGRYIWQIKNYADLLICWKATPKDDPREIEKQLLQKYINQFGVRPFANLTG